MKKFSTQYLCGLTTLLAFSGCAHRPSTDTLVTQLQVREIQSRDFDTNDTKLVMKSMMNVLQDEGFIIKNAVLELGLLSAEKNIDTENKAAAFASILFCGVSARWEKHQILEASANVSSFGDSTRVRMTFQTKTVDNYGCPTKVTTVTDMKSYQNFFEKVSKGIFLQKENI